MPTVLPTDNVRLVGRSVFSRVLVGVDGTVEALEAARQAALLRSTETGFALLSAWELAPPPIAGLAAPAFSRPTSCASPRSKR